MPATTAAFGQGNFAIEYSANGTTWTDLCGVTTSINPGAPEHAVGETHVACSPYAILTPSNKIGPREIEINAVYTEAVTEAFEVLYAIFISSDRGAYLRWAPNGNTIGNMRFTTSADGTTAGKGIITKCTIPEQDASSEDPALFSVTIKAAHVIKAAIAT